MKPVVQQDRTGCGIACVAALAGQAYAAVKHEARKLGIEVTDPQLWSDTKHMQQLLARFDLSAGKQVAFSSWDALPECALLAIKWHRETHGTAWHWVVFTRDASGSSVLDPKKALRTNRRTDFGRMKPKWFIRVENQRRTSRQ